MDDTIDKNEVFSKYHEIKTWRKAGFKLVLYDSIVIPSQSKYGILRDYLPYRFYDKRELIFEGYDFSPSPMYAWDSLDSVYALLGFLSCQPGDTDAEYFESYTPRQLEWSESSRCEELSIYVYDWEERRSNRR